MKSKTFNYVKKILSPDDFKLKIIEEVSGLKESISKKDHVKITSLIREFVYNDVIWSLDGLYIKEYCNGNISELTAPEIHYLFLNKEIGVLCGGTAHYLAKIYNLFGYDAGIFNFGIPSIFTHVVTLVAIPEFKDKKLIIQDATFNLTYLIDNKICSFFQLTDLLLESKFDNISIKMDFQKLRSTYYNKPIKYSIKEKTLLTNREIYRVDSNLYPYASYLYNKRNNILKAISQNLNKSISHCNILELMLFPIYISKFKDKNLQIKINKWKKDLINFHCKTNGISIKNYKKVVIFGAGGKLKSNFDFILSNLKKNAYIFIVDNDKNKWNKTIKGIKIFSPDYIKTIKPEVVIIVSTFAKEIFVQLKKIMKEYDLTFDVIIFEDYFQFLIINNKLSWFNNKFIN